MPFDKDKKYGNHVLLDESEWYTLKDWEHLNRIISTNVRELIPDEYLDRVSIRVGKRFVKWKYE